MVFHLTPNALHRRFLFSQIFAAFALDCGRRGLAVQTVLEIVPVALAERFARKDFFDVSFSVQDANLIKHKTASKDGDHILRIQSSRGGILCLFKTIGLIL